MDNKWANWEWFGKKGNSNLNSSYKKYMNRRTKPTKWNVSQRRLRSSVQSGQSLCCPLEETWGPKLPIERPSKSQLRLGGCPGWSESSLGAHIIVFVFSRHAVAYIILRQKSTIRYSKPIRFIDSLKWLTNNYFHISLLSFNKSY